LIIERIERENATGLLHIIKEEFDDWPIFDQYIEQEIISNEKTISLFYLKKLIRLKSIPFFLLNCLIMNFMKRYLHFFKTSIRCPQKTMEQTY
jgi:hypothetical protein